MAENGSRKLLDRDRLVLEIRRASRPALALAVLILIFIVCVAIIFSNNGISLPWQSTYQRQIALDNAKGLVAKEQTVRLAGVTVGRIESIRLVHDRPVATISLQPKYGPLYRNAELRLRPETPLDDMYIDIVSRGTPSAGALPANAILPAQRTQVPVDISSVLDVFNVDTRTRAKESIDALGQGLGTQGPAFRQALVELAPFLSAARRITQVTAVRQVQTARLVHNFSLLTQELGRRDVEVRGLVAQGASTLSELAGQERSVQDVVAQLPPTMTQLESTFTTLSSTTLHLNPAFDELQSVAAALPAGLRGLTRFGTAATPALSRLRAPLPGLNRLMAALQPTASGLHGTFAALQPLPRQLSTVTGQVIPCETALAKFFQNTISLGKFQSNLSVVLRGETVVGTNSAGGAVNDLVAPKSCAPGGP
jgi:ABC-type transporter Mla subunit MlaD